MPKRLLGKLDSHSREILGKGSLSLATKVVGTALNFLLQILIGRMLGADGVGVYYLSMSVTVFVALVARLGMDYEVTKVVASQAGASVPDDLLVVLRRAFLIAAVSSTIFAACLFLASEPLARLVFSKPELGVPLQVMAISTIPLALTILLARAFQGLKRVVQAMALETVVTPFVACLLVLVLAPRYDVAGAAAAYVFGGFTTLLVGMAAWLRSRRVSGKPPHQDSPVRPAPYVGPSIPLLGVLVLQQIAQVLPLFVLGALASSAEVGLYYAAQRTAALVGLILIAGNSIITPKFSALYKSDDLQSLDQVVRHSAMLLTALAIPPLLLFFSFPSAVMSIFGPEFAAHANLLRVMSLGQLVNVMTGSIGFLLMMTDRSVSMLMTTFWMLLTNAVLSFSLVPEYGALGASIAMASSLAVAALFRIIVVWRAFGILALPVPFPIRRLPGGQS